MNYTANNFCQFQHLLRRNNCLPLKAIAGGKGNDGRGPRQALADGRQLTRRTFPDGQEQRTGLFGEERMSKPFPPVRKTDRDITHLRMDFRRIGLSIASRSKDHMWEEREWMGYEEQTESWAYLQPHQVQSLQVKIFSLYWIVSNHLIALSLWLNTVLERSCPKDWRQSYHCCNKPHKMPRSLIPWFKETSIFSAADEDITLHTLLLHPLTLCWDGSHGSQTTTKAANIGVHYLQTCSMSGQNCTHLKNNKALGSPVWL